MSSNSRTENDNEPLPDWNHHPELPIKLSPVFTLNIILLETWVSREHQEKYLQWRAVEALGSMLSQAPSIRYYDNSSI